jgi:16S rRNA (guanine966-N2)-methyltransferase
VSALRKLSSKLGTKLVRIHAGDARRAISRLGQSQFDLIFLDPPFGQGWFPNLLGEVYPLLTPQGLVYVEAETIIAAPKGYIALRQSRAGAVHYQLFQRVALQES